MSRPLVTVKTLLAQAREGGEIELPADALITPAAADWLHGSRVTVRRVDSAAPVASGPIVYVVGDAANPVVQTLLPALERRPGDVRFMPCNGHLAGLLEALQGACAGLADCARRRGIVLVEDGAIVNCVANRHPKVRAAIVSRPSSLFGLLRKLGVNLLILETGRMSLRQMQATIEEYLSAKTGVDAAIEAALAEPQSPREAGCHSGGCQCAGAHANGHTRCATCTRTKCGVGA